MYVSKNNLRVLSTRTPKPCLKYKTRSKILDIPFKNRMTPNLKKETKYKLVIGKCG